MGAGIAAHLANAGVQVLLLDMVPHSLSDSERNQRKARNRLASDAVAKALKSKPALFYHPLQASRIEVGNLEDDLPRLKQVDLVIEAIVERLDLKRALFEKIEALQTDCILASNTSGLRMTDMLAGRSEAFRKNFLVMHFFNPVRYMKLLELVASPDTDPHVFERVRDLSLIHI